MYPTKTGDMLRCSGKVSSLCFLQDTRHVAHVKSSKSNGHHDNKTSLLSLSLDGLVIPTNQIMMTSIKLSEG